MDISGTLHLYSGEDRELFFVFDDDVAQQLYQMGAFSLQDKETRRVMISVGSDRYIHVRTMSFSKKQTEVKVSLCSHATRQGLRSLTALYDWYAPGGRTHPEPFPVLGKLRRIKRGGEEIWELLIEEPVDLVVPPGLGRRKKISSRSRRTWRERRRIEQRDLRKIGRIAEELAVRVCQEIYPAPKYKCLWRDEYYDSERPEIRSLGIIADIDIWDEEAAVPVGFVEVKSQKTAGDEATPQFYLSNAEWRSYLTAKRRKLPYQLWIFQYTDIAHFQSSPNEIKLVVLDQIRKEWLEPDSFFVRVPEGTGRTVTMSSTE